jgi:hypothetical protein
MYQHTWYIAGVLEHSFEGKFGGNALFPLNNTTIYRMAMEESRWNAVSPGSEWSIPTLRADFLCFTSKSVLISPNLLGHSGDVVNWPKVRTNWSQGSDFGLKTWTRRIPFTSDRFGSGSFKARSRNLSCIFCLKNDVY